MWKELNRDYMQGIPLGITSIYLWKIVHRKILKIEQYDEVNENNSAKIFLR